MKYLFSLLLLISSTSFALTPFSAEYVANFKLPFSGSASIKLTQQDNNWQYKFEASMLVASITETSIFDLTQNKLSSKQYSYLRSGMGGGNKNIQQTFHENGVVSIKRSDKVSEITVPKEVLDKSLYQIALQRDLAAGMKEFSYQVLDGNDLETYKFKVVGYEEIKTKAGKFSAVKVERIRENSKRHTLIWFASDFNFLLIKLEQSETDGKNYQIVLKKAVIAGRKITGKK